MLKDIYTIRREKVRDLIKESGLSRADFADDYPEWEISGDDRESNGFRLIGWVFHWSVMETW